MLHHWLFQAPGRHMKLTYRDARQLILNNPAMRWAVGR
jgi:hypothetical protein